MKHDRIAAVLEGGYGTEELPGLVNAFIKRIGVV